jgi:hypothetical protein
MITESSENFEQESVMMKACRGKTGLVHKNHGMKSLKRALSSSQHRFPMTETRTGLLGMRSVEEITDSAFYFTFKAWKTILLWHSSS